MARLRFRKATVAVLTGFLMAFTALGPVRAADVIKVGVVGPLSGDLASYGISALRGVELVVKEINAKGGVLGRQIQVLPEDDLCQPKDAANKATKMVAQGVHAVIGHICSGATQAALGIYKDAEIIAISPSATNPDLTQSGDYPNFYRTIAPDDAQAKVQVDFALDVLKLKEIAVLHDKGVYGKGLVEFVKASLEKRDGAEMVLYEGIAPGTVDYSLVAQKIKRSKAEAVIFGGYHPGAAKIVTQMRKKKMQTIFISGDGVKDEAFVEAAGEHAEGVYATAPTDTSQTPLAIAANEAHKEEYGSDPGPFFFSASAATLALAHAIEEAGSTDYDDLSRAMKIAAVDTPIGRILFDEKGDAIGVGFSVYQVQNGAFVQIR